MTKFKKKLSPDTTQLNSLPNGTSRATFMEPVTYWIEKSRLIVPPFKIEKYGQIYINPVELIIKLRNLRPGPYRVIAVHNFHVEDSNPNLKECLGGIFLAAKLADEKWEEPEKFPVECRSLQTLGYIHVKPWILT